MAKKQTSDPSGAPRRRTPKRATPPPPVDNVFVPPSAPRAATPSGNGGSAAPPERTAPEPSYDEIAQAAYLRYLDRGGTDGSDFDDWLEAERDLRRKG